MQTVLQGEGGGIAEIRERGVGDFIFGKLTTILTITGLSIHFVIHYGGNYHFLLIQNVIERPKEVKSTPSEYSGVVMHMTCASYLFCH